MTFAKPAVQRWDTNLTNIATPSAGQVAAGFATNDPLPSNWLNRFLNIAGEWQAYLDERFAGSAAGELKIIKQIQSNNGTTDPSLDILAGTGVGSRGIKAVGGNSSSVAIVGAVGASGAEIDTQTNSNFPGTGVMGISKVTGLPGVLGAQIGTAGPGVWGTGANGPGVQGTGVAGPGGAFSGGGYGINTLLGFGGYPGIFAGSTTKAGIFATGAAAGIPGVLAYGDDLSGADMTTAEAAAAGAGLIAANDHATVPAIYARNFGTGPGIVIVGNTTRAPLRITGQAATPSGSLTNGDLYNLAGYFETRDFITGGDRARLVSRIAAPPQSGTTAVTTTSATAITGATFQLLAAPFPNGTRLRLKFGCLVNHNSGATNFTIAMQVGASTITNMAVTIPFPSNGTRDVTYEAIFTLSGTTMTGMCSAVTTGTAAGSSTGASALSIGGGGIQSGTTNIGMYATWATSNASNAVTPVYLTLEVI